MDVSASREGINLLGALTETGETMFLECSGSFITEVTIQFLQKLQDRFGEELVVVSDKGSCFTAKVREFGQHLKRPICRESINTSVDECIRYRTPHREGAESLVSSRAVPHGDVR